MPFVLSQRTEVSYATPAEDIRVLKELIPILVKGPPTLPVTTPSTNLEPGVVDLKELKRSVWDEETQRLVVAPDQQLLIQGANTLRIAREYILWRHGYESAWISSRELGGTTPTPVAEIIGNVNISARDRAEELARFYWFEASPKPENGTGSIPRLPGGTVVEIENIGVQVQFQPAANQVVVRSLLKGGVDFIPYDPTQDTRDWLRNFEKDVAVHGFERACAKLKSTTHPKNRPPASPPPDLKPMEGRPERRR